MENNNENKDTEEQIIKSVSNHIIDQTCNQSKITLIETSDEIVKIKN